MRALRLAIVCVVLAALFAPAVASAADLGLTVQQTDVSKHPEVTLRVSLPAELLGANGRPQFSVAENGTDLGAVRAAPERTQSRKAYAILLIDTSGSMLGQPLVDARAAASRFVDELGQNAEIAVVAFSDEPRVLSGFTSDRTRLQNAIGSLEAQGETAVYDALVTAAGLMPGSPDAAKSIVLLSDGGDTVSGNSLASAIREVRDSRSNVYAVALKTKEASPRALNVIAQDTGGRHVSVKRSSALSGLFTGIARELRDVYVVSYTSNSPSTKDVDVDVAATVGDKTATAYFAYPNPRFSIVGNPAELKVPETKDDPLLYAAVVVVAFLAVAIFAVGILMLVIRPSTGLKQLKYYDQLQVGSDSSNHGVVGDKVRAGIVDAVGYVAGKRGFTQTVSIMLEQAGLPLRAVEYMSIHIVAVVVIGFLTQLLLGNFLFSVVIIATTTILPILLLNVAVDKRRSKFDAQLADVLSMMAGSLRGGWGIQQALDLVVQEAMPPANEEFKRVQTEVRLGMPLDESLQRMAERMNSDDFRAVVAAITIQRDVGGNLAEVLDVVATTVRERAALRRQVDALTAEGRLSAIILILLPIIEAVALSFVSPNYLEPLYTSFFGFVSLVLGVVLMVVGSIWLIKTTKIEV